MRSAGCRPRRRRPERDDAGARSSSACRAVSIRRSRRCCCSARACRSPACSCRTGKKTTAPVHAAPMPTARTRWPSARGSAFRCTCAISPPNTGTRCSRTSSTNTAPAARRIRTCCATAKSSSSTFLDHARALGAEKIATGHYARVDRADGRWRLLRARDAAKDQSYFLHALQQEALSATLFPIGEHAEARRARARARGDAADAREEGLDRHLLHRRARFPRVPRRLHSGAPGEIRTPDGATVGEHTGVFFYTLGQRSGLGIGGRAESAGDPWYVVGKDVATQRADRRARQRERMAAVASARRERPHLGRRRGACRRIPLHGEDALPAGRSGLRRAHLRRILRSRPSTSRSAR